MDPLIYYCEPKYAISPYIYEFTNTISNIPYFFLALQLPKSDKYFMMGVFFGSSLFHGIKPNFYIELLDEIPMLFCVNNIIFKIKKKKRAKAFFYLLDMLMIYLYFKTRIYELFLNYFTYKILFVVYHASHNNLKVRSIIFLIVAKICWSIEQHYCIYDQKLYIFHTFWHALSAISYYLMHKSVTQ